MKFKRILHCIFSILLFLSGRSDKPSNTRGDDAQD